MTIGVEAPTPWKLPTRGAAIWFQLRVWGHVLWRGLRNACGPTVQRYCAADRLQNATVIAESRTPLWRDGRDDEFSLVAGKVHNLRLSRLAFDGVVVPAGRVLSFWRQLGRPGRRRGFVAGREIQAGCVVPTIAGGLCQLSNALASCALDAGMTLVERHGHTARVENTEGYGGLGAVDATVFWNYVDLRFVADFDCRIEVELTSDELVVRIRADKAVGRIARKPITTITPVDNGKASKPIARGCLTCDEAACFRHRTQMPQRASGSTAVLVNAWSPEFDRHLRELPGDADWFVPWVKPKKRTAGAWMPLTSRRQAVAFLASLRRSLYLHRYAGEGGGRQAAVLQGNRWIAEQYARRLQPHHTHLIVDQSLLVSLAEAGVLGGRTYEVLLHALPAGELQRRLDVAAARWPDAPSLLDFRVCDAYCATEINALRRAEHLVTPHTEVVRYLQSAIDGASIKTIDWTLPRPSSKPRAAGSGAKPMIAFPASALARKGAHEMAHALRHLGWRLLVLGTPPSDSRVWSGIDVTFASFGDPEWLTRADAVALPAHIEHLPRGLLAAIANGVPVVASPACGLSASFNPIEVLPGDVPGLIAALRKAVNKL
jgi:hypothetical protein